MATVTWELRSADSVDNYKIENEDGTVSFIDGVIISVSLIATATEGENKVSHPNVFVPLKKPVISEFVQLSSLQKEEVLSFALQTLSSQSKNSIEEFLIRKLNSSNGVSSVAFES